jgi:hypothetical protein
MNSDEVRAATQGGNDVLGFGSVIGSSIFEAALAASMPLIEKRLYARWNAERDDRLCGDMGPGDLRCDLLAGHVAHRQAGSGTAWIHDPPVAAALDPAAAQPEETQHAD